MAKQLTKLRVSKCLYRYPWDGATGLLFSCIFALIKSKSNSEYLFNKRIILQYLTSNVLSCNYNPIWIYSSLATSPAPYIDICIKFKRKGTSRMKDKTYWTATNYVNKYFNFAKNVPIIIRHFLYCYNEPHSLHAAKLDWLEISPSQHPYIHKRK